MKNLQRQAFTLVELLVVITILAIISVVAYQNFGGAVDKAVSGRKIQDISTIETSLQQYKADKNYYPPTGIKGTGTDNLWGYNSGTTATPSNQIQVSYTGEEINTIITANSVGGGIVYGSGVWGPTVRQIGAKGTISQKEIGKKYLTKDLYDPELGDIKVNSTSNKMIDYGIGRYVYATYKKNKSNGVWASNFRGNAYNIAITLKKDGSDKYITKIVGDYDEESCYDDKANCPNTLIGLTEGTEENGNSNTPNYGVPYAVTDFAQ